VSDLFLVTGGARSGKSAFAERLAAQKGNRLLYVATMEPEDEEMRDRVREHQARRGPDWDTLVEPVRLADVIREHGSSHDAVLIDCATLWLTNLIWPPADRRQAESTASAAASELCAAIRASRAAVIVVTNEIGSGIVPASSESRHFRDIIGRVNQILAAAATEVYFVSCGISLPLKALQRISPIGDDTGVAASGP
jgi:adenosylcobinamide kinase/adenosylcobinamide-phosphate guanylyltransferase